MLHCVLKQAASPDSKFWSDRLLHETLYLCGVILADEDADKTNSLCNAAIGVIGSEYNRVYLLSSVSSLFHYRPPLHSVS